VEPSTIRKIDLNKDDFKVINKHPYLSYELTRQIFSYRKKTVINSANVAEVLGDAGLAAKMAPYLSFD
jgi:hypothetical protein